MEIGVEEAAGRLGVSGRRVRALIQSERLHARRVGGRWLVDEAALGGKAASSRAMSPRMAWAFIISLSRKVDQGGAQKSGGRWPDLFDRLDLAAAELHRLDERMVRLVGADDPALMLRSWLRNRAQRHLYSAAPDDVAALVRDERVVHSGASHAAAGISSSGEFEGYIALGEEPDFVEEYLMSAVGPHNVVLHVLAADSVVSLAEIRSNEVGMSGVVLADLADRGAARENSRIVELLTQVRAGIEVTG